MKKVRCPQCDNYITFDETRYAQGQTLVFQCPTCQKQFRIRINNKTDTTQSTPCSSITVVENIFHYKQTIPLRSGDNIIGRYIKGTTINTPIETSDPSMDTRHCIINVKKNKDGTYLYSLRDAPSNTGTYYMNTLLTPYDRINLTNGSIITIGATTLILNTNSTTTTPTNEI